nr:T-cell receptor-associated transmembrane adapter 1 isoform X4 [Columba livia]
MDCHFSVWGVLAFLSLALVVSLILNISHYMKKKQAKKCKDYEENSPSYDGYYTEDDPVYGNLNQEILEECCYEQMKSQPQRTVNQLQWRQPTTSTRHSAQELLRNVQYNGGLRSFTKEMRALKMTRVAASHCKLTITSSEQSSKLIILQLQEKLLKNLV